MIQHRSMIKTRQKLGKYLIERRLGEGGFAAVFQALDTIEGVRVALKIPFPHVLTKEVLHDFRREVRLAASLKHPHILQLKNAEYIDGHLVLAFPLGERTLADRLQYRLSLSLALELAEQLLDAVAYAHQRRVIHCDITPENLLLFPGNRLALTDFGIAKVAMRTIRASGSGTVGFVAPEQAMGKPSFRSDVFSSGLVIYRMLSGHLPEWPFAWPPPGLPRLRERVHPDLIDLLRRSVELEPRKRFPDAARMLAAFRRIKPRALRGRKRSSTRAPKQTERKWRTMRLREFRRQYGRLLETNQSCHKCHGPLSEPMEFCAWCGTRKVQQEETRFPQKCPRCQRGMKLDWHYCPWCFGPGFEVAVDREYTDTRYVASCSSPKCTRKDLMPFMRYCPWCRRKVRRKWKLGNSNDTCNSCGWGVTREFWEYCPWCGAQI